MTNHQLLIRLRDFHEQLSAINDDLEPATQIDDLTIDRLGQLVTDASALVDQVKSCASCETIQAEQENLVKRITCFENTHPRVSEFLSRMTDFLAMTGLSST